MRWVKFHRVFKDISRMRMMFENLDKDIKVRGKLREIYKI